MSQPARGAFGAQAAMQVAKASYDRCCADAGFLRAFYDDFFARCPEAKPRFAGTDFERQNKLLRHAFGILLIFPNQARTEPSVLTRVAERHSRRDLDIPPALYGPFLESLIATVGRCDPEFSSAVERAWRETVAPGMAYMRAKY
ncbi:MAG: globin [Gemmatimonadetes bacterium]|nr:MAG: globin [Gemmatimonadota bacterium]